MPSERLAKFASAQRLASRCLAIAFGMAAPSFAGYAIDQRVGTTPWLALLGIAIGLAYGIWRLLKLGNDPGLSGDKPS